MALESQKDGDSLSVRGVGGSFAITAAGILGMLDKQGKGPLSLRKNAVLESLIGQVASAGRLDKTQVALTIDWKTGWTSLMITN